MRTILPFLLAGVLAGCAGGPASRGTPVAAGELFASTYVNVRAPASDGWLLVRSSATGIAFAKEGGAKGESLVATVNLFNLPPTSTPEELEALIETGARKDTDSSRFDVLEESSEYTEDRGYPCVHYRSLSRDKAPRGSSAPLLLALDGLYCRHPVREEMGFAAIYSFRGAARRDSLRDEAQRFIESVQVPAK